MSPGSVRHPVTKAMIDRDLGRHPALTSGLLIHAYTAPFNPACICVHAHTNMKLVLMQKLSNRKHHAHGNGYWCEQLQESANKYISDEHQI